MRTQHPENQRAQAIAPQKKADPFGVGLVYQWVVEEILSTNLQPSPITVYGPQHRREKLPGGHVLPHRMNKFSLAVIESTLNLRFGDRASVRFERHYTYGGDDYVTITITMGEGKTHKPPTVATVAQRVVALLGKTAYEEATGFSFDVRGGQHFQVRLDMADYGLTYDNVLAVLEKVNAQVVEITKVPRENPVTAKFNGDVLDLDVDLRGAPEALPWDDWKNLHKVGEEGSSH